jgi:7-carboxy-7-deazaguanine synthase
MRISEIYSSIMGESTFQGFPCVILRLAGCNLNCVYCDTPQAADTLDGQNVDMSIDKIVDKVSSLGPSMVLVTGGEPMIHSEAQLLIERLVSCHFVVVLETNGTCDLSTVPDEVVKIVDVKCPGSGEEGKFLFSNLTCIDSRDQLKFVIMDREDYEWSIAFLQENDLIKVDGPTSLKTGPRILFSPVYERLDPGSLAAWILEDRINVQINLQMHKYIGMP